MRVHINTDRNIDGRETMAQQAEATIMDALGYLAERLTRVEAHLSDVNARKGGANDKRCVMEARIEGRQPLAVTDEAPTVEQAIAGAADKLRSALESTLGRWSEKGDQSIRRSEDV